MSRCIFFVLSLVLTMILAAHAAPAATMFEGQWFSAELPENWSAGRWDGGTRFSFQGSPSVQMLVNTGRKSIPNPLELVEEFRMTSSKTLPDGKGIIGERNKDFKRSWAVLLKSGEYLGISVDGPHEDIAKIIASLRFIEDKENLGNLFDAAKDAEQSGSLAGHLSTIGKKAELHREMLGAALSADALDWLTFKTPNLDAAKGGPVVAEFPDFLQDFGAEPWVASGKSAASPSYDGTDFLFQNTTDQNLSVAVFYEGGAGGGYTHKFGWFPVQAGKSAIVRIPSDSRLIRDSTYYYAESHPKPGQKKLYWRGEEGASEIKVPMTKFSLYDNKEAPGARAFAFRKLDLQDQLQEPSEENGWWALPMVEVDGIGRFTVTLEEGK